MPAGPLVVAGDGEASGRRRDVQRRRAAVAVVVAGRPQELGLRLVLEVLHVDEAARDRRDLASHSRARARNAYDRAVLLDADEEQPGRRGPRSAPGRTWRPWTRPRAPWPRARRPASTRSPRGPGSRRAAAALPSGSHCWVAVSGGSPRPRRRSAGPAGTRPCRRRRRARSRRRPRSGRRRERDALGVRVADAVGVAQRAYRLAHPAECRPGRAVVAVSSIERARVVAHRPQRPARSGARRLVREPAHVVAELGRRVADRDRRAARPGRACDRAGARVRRARARLGRDRVGVPWAGAVRAASEGGQRRARSTSGCPRSVAASNTRAESASAEPEVCPAPNRRSTTQVARRRRASCPTGIASGRCCCCCRLMMPATDVHGELGRC